MTIALVHLPMILLMVATLELVTSLPTRFLIRSHVTEANEFRPDDTVLYFPDRTKALTVIMKLKK